MSQVDELEFVRNQMIQKKRLSGVKICMDIILFCNCQHQKHFYYVAVEIALCLI